MLSVALRIKRLPMTAQLRQRLEKVTLVARVAVVYSQDVTYLIGSVLRRSGVRCFYAITRVLFNTR